LSKNFQKLNAIILFVSTIYTYQQTICYSLQTMQIVHHTLIISKNDFACQKKKI